VTPLNYQFIREALAEVLKCHKADILARNMQPKPYFWLGADAE
jgi:hypothetical protein